MRPLTLNSLHFSATRVAILDANSFFYFETYFACARIGAILCPLNLRASPRELAGVLSDSGARVLLAGPSFASQVTAVIEAGGSPTAVTAGVVGVVVAGIATVAGGLGAAFRPTAGLPSSKPVKIDGDTWGDGSPVTAPVIAPDPRTAGVVP
jgi:acyl-CoA synthetase (AMP-forming)/AMP-acid ligase II